MSRERPILFSAPMVRALLAGTKTQTRRIVKPQPEWRPAGDGYAGGWSALGKRKPDELRAWADEGAFARELMKWGSPYGAPGDTLWVREAFAVLTGAGTRTVYRADGEPTQRYFPAEPVHNMKWTPSIHMPRWASRITLRVTDVRVERLQDISEEDAKAEGVEPTFYSEHWTAYDPITEGYPSFTVEPDAAQIAERGLENVRHHPPKLMCSAREQFRRLWESINGPGSWDANPWVWVVSFERVTA